MDVPAAVATTLAALETGDWAPVKDVLAPDVVYEASVPEWHFSMAGVDDVLGELSGLTSQHTWRYHDRRLTKTENGVLVEMEIRGRCPGDDHHAAHEEASRNALVFELDGEGRISEMRLTCSGEWGDDVIARIEAEAPRVR
jgi:ketosteroid isomerase-like protein